MRVAGVIIKDGKILLMRRFKNGEEYFVFPGGGVEQGESLEDAMEREIKEELSLGIKNYKKVFEIENRGVKEVYYLIMEFDGKVELGGPEKERMNDNDQYHPEWMELMKAAELKNLFPREAVSKLKRLPTTHPNPEYYKALPKKRMGSGVLLFNDNDEILIVKPSYKDNWSIPGGVVDESESPREASIRETREEVGIELKNPQFLCVEYTRRSKDENLFFMFYGGKLSLQQVKGIKIDKDEIGEYKFVTIEKAVELIGRSAILAKVLLKCLPVIKNAQPLYLENGGE